MSSGSVKSVDCVRRHVLAITSQGPRHGESAAAALNGAAGYIEAELRSYGCETRRQEFQVRGGRTRTGVNILGTLRGTDASLPGLLIGAHYDTRPMSPGADDNASGVAAMLETARILSSSRPARGVVFAGFDAEERQDPGEGLWGSSAYVQTQKAGELAGAFILEMVGYASRRGTQRVPLGFRVLFPAAGARVWMRRNSGDFLVAVSRGRGNRLAKSLSASARRAGANDILTLCLPGWISPPKDLLRSDHAPFWLAGVPAVMIGDTANFRNPNYHLPSDTPETLDYDMIAGLAAALAETVAGQRCPA